MRMPSPRLALLALVLICLGLTTTACTRDKAETTSPDTSETTSTRDTARTTDSAPDPTAGLTEEDLYTLTLHFPEGEVIMKSYSSLSRQAMPRLFLLVYIGLAHSYPQLQSDPDSLIGSYFLDSTAGHIIFPVEHATAASPVIQTMQLVTEAELATKTAGCNTTVYDLSPLDARSFDCSADASATNFNRSSSCAVEVDDTHTLLYQQTTSDPSVADDLCDTLKKNYIQSIELQPY